MSGSLQNVEENNQEELWSSRTNTNNCLKNIHKNLMGGDIIKSIHSKDPWVNIRLNSRQTRSKSGCATTRHNGNVIFGKRNSRDYELHTNAIDSSIFPLKQRRYIKKLILKKVTTYRGFRKVISDQLEKEKKKEPALFNRHF